MLVGWFTGISLLYYLGGALLIIGLALLALGSLGRPVAGRSYWW